MIRDIDREWLLDMLEFAQTAVRVLGPRDAAEIEGDEVVFLALSYAVQVIGEAASKVSLSARAVLPEEQWRGAIGMRHKLVHGYRVRQAIFLEQTIREDLPVLIRSLKAVLTEEGP